jgi:hypothetical protein
VLRIVEHLLAIKDSDSQTEKSNKSMRSD